MIILFIGAVLHFRQPYVRSTGFFIWLHTSFVRLPVERTNVVTIGAPLNKYGFEMSLLFICLRSGLSALVWLVSLFNGISTIVGYLMPKPFSLKNSSWEDKGVHTFP